MSAPSDASVKSPNMTSGLAQRSRMFILDLLVSFDIHSMSLHMEARKGQRHKRGIMRYLLEIRILSGD